MLILKKKESLVKIQIASQSFIAEGYLSSLFHQMKMLLFLFSIIKGRYE